MRTRVCAASAFKKVTRRFMRQPPPTFFRSAWRNPSALPYYRNFCSISCLILAVKDFGHVEIFFVKKWHETVGYLILLHSEVRWRARAVQFQWQSHQNSNKTLPICKFSHQNRQYARLFVVFPIDAMRKNHWTRDLWDILLLKKGHAVFNLKHLKCLKLHLTLSNI